MGASRKGKQPRPLHDVIRQRCYQALDCGWSLLHPDTLTCMLLFTLALVHAEPSVPWYTILACSCSLLRSCTQNLLCPGTLSWHALVHSCAHACRAFCTLVHYPGMLLFTLALTHAEPFVPWHEGATHPLLLLPPGRQQQFPGR